MWSTAKVFPAVIQEIIASLHRSTRRYLGTKSIFFSFGYFLQDFLFEKYYLLDIFVLLRGLIRNLKGT